MRERSSASMLPGMTETDALARGLRTALHSLLDSGGARRAAPAVLHVGLPGGRAHQRWAVVDDDSYDAGFRADLVVRGLDAVELDRPFPWLTRGGALVPLDVDLRWCAASRLAFERCGLELPGFFVVTSAGWFDLVAEEVVPIVPRRRRRVRKA